MNTLYPGELVREEEATELFAAKFSTIAAFKDGHPAFTAAEDLDDIFLVSQNY